MNAEIFAEWLRRQQEPVRRTEHSYWVQAFPGVYQAFPYHWVIEPGPAELHDLLLGSRALALRYSTPWQSGQGAASYHVGVCKERYALNDLGRKVRSTVRKGLGQFKVEQISFARLAVEGWPAHAQTLERQGRAGAESLAWWQRLCLSAHDLPGFEAWAAISDGQVAASMILFTCEQTCSILYQQSLTAALRQGVNNVLAYVVTTELLARPDIDEMFYGLHSLDAPASVDEFKFRMGYLARPVRQRVVFHPWLSPAVIQAGYRLVERLHRRYPLRPRLAKAEGMLRFYLEGLRPPDQQCWPEVLKREL